MEVNPTFFLSKQSRSGEGVKICTFSKLQNIPQKAVLDFTELTTPTPQFCARHSLTKTLSLWQQGVLSSADQTCPMDETAKSLYV